MSTSSPKRDDQRNDQPFGPAGADLLRLLVENVKDYAIVLLDTEGKVLSWNPAAERLKGWTA